MSSPEFRYEPPRDRGARDGAADIISHAVAERERGRRRLNKATATVSFASVVAAGAVAATLPGSTHAAVTGTSHSPTATSGAAKASGSSKASGSEKASGSSKAAGSSKASGSSNSSNSAGSANSSGNSSDQGSPGTLQAPASAPVQSGGGGQVTSGGTSGW